MLEEMNRYLTEAEQEQINELLARAMKRREEDGKEGEESGGDCQFLFARNREQTGEVTVSLDLNCGDELKQFLKELFPCCRRVCGCSSAKDEELPFR